MPKLNLTKTIAEGAQPEAKDYEIRDAAVPGFVLKVTPTGRKMFMLACTAANGQRRKPAIDASARSPSSRRAASPRTGWRRCDAVQTRAPSAPRLAKHQP